MQPMGRKPSRFPSKTDCHPPKGHMNWWEAEMGTGANKKADRFAGKKEIERRLLDEPSVKSPLSVDARRHYVGTRES